MEKPKVISSEIVYRGKVFSVYREKFATSKGIAEIEVVRHKGAVAVLPILNNGDIILEKQFRYSVNDFLYEVPAGTLEENEPPEVCAKRELLEETGYQADTLSYITYILMSPGYVDEKIYLYVARVSKKTEAKLEKDEIIETETHSADEAIKMIKEGKIIDAKTISLILLAKSLGYI